MKYFFLIVIGLLLYLPSLPNKFVWDDEEQVVENSAVHSLSQLPSIFAGSTFNSGGSERLGGLYYKPLMSASFAVIYTVFGPSPWAFHLFQITLHIGTTLLLYIILQRLWKRDWVSFAVAMLFLIHPQNVETVVYISSLQDTLYMFFGVLGLTWIVISETRLKWGDLLVAGALLLLAMLSKETGVLFSIIIGAYLWMRSLDHARDDVSKWLIVVALVFGTYFYLRIGIAGVGLEKNMFTPMATMPLVDRLGNVPGIVWHYLAQFVWPSRLSISQHWVNRDPGLFDLFQLITITCSWVAILCWGIKNKVRNFVFFWIWFGVAIAFHSQIFPLDMTVADRWFYLPMIGLIGSVGSLESTKSTKFIKWLSIIILVALFVRSSVRIQNWRDGFTLYSHDVQIMTNSFDLENNLGVELYRVGKMSDARDHFAKSIEISPTWWTNWNNLGVIVEDEGELDTALSYYKKAIDNGNYYLAYCNYGRVLIKQKKYDEAKVFVRNSLKLYPSNTTLLELYHYLSILENK